MIDEFRAAFQELIDASVATDPERFPPAVQRVYHLASQVPPEERELALEALGPFLGGGHTAPGITADLAVVAGAFVEMGAGAGPAGTEVVRLMRSIGQGAAVFLYAWERTGGGRPPDPDQVTAATEERVAAELGETAPTAAVCWWTVGRYGLAAKTMLSEAEVRSAVRADAELRAELVAIANQLSGVLPQFGEIRALLRMAEATSALVLERASGRGFRVLFDGIGDNLHLHTLLADALIGSEGRGLPGERPDPRWTAAFRNAAPDPQARVVRGWWNLTALDGSWVWNEGVPADIPTVDGERLLVLEPQPYPRSWNAGRRHPQVMGWLEVEEEITTEEAETWWRRAAPAQTGPHALYGAAEQRQEPREAPSPDTGPPAQHEQPASPEGSAAAQPQSRRPDPADPGEQPPPPGAEDDAPPQGHPAVPGPVGDSAPHVEDAGAEGGHGYAPQGGPSPAPGPAPGPGADGGTYRDASGTGAGEFHRAPADGCRAAETHNGPGGPAPTSPESADHECSPPPRPTPAHDGTAAAQTPGQEREPAAPASAADAQDTPARPGLPRPDSAPQTAAPTTVLPAVVDLPDNGQRPEPAPQPGERPAAEPSPLPMPQPERGSESATAHGGVGDEPEPDGGPSPAGPEPEHAGADADSADNGADEQAQAAEDAEEPGSAPPRPGQLPPLPKGVSDNSAWGPKWL